mmetsp:Transcript_81126/g.204239  ORF Transcript_81126/g.204239 Transcript_81126/m.204239 type:complete len:207 (-) Transcript_81126:1586-2206(-)
MAIRRSCARVAHQHALDDASHSCARLQVPEVGLRAGLHEGHGGSILHHALQGADLDGIPQRGAGAVELGAGHLAGSEACLLHGAADALLLGGSVRRRHAGAPAVLVEASTDHGACCVIGAHLLRPGEEGPASLTTLESIGRHIECEAPAVGREHVRPAKVDEIAWARHHVGAHHERLPQRGADTHGVLSDVSRPLGCVPDAVGHQR